MQVLDLKKTATTIAEKIKATPLLDISFSEEGVAAFADFAWTMGRVVSQFRKAYGWKSPILESLLTEIKEALEGESLISLSDLFHFCDFYIGTLRLSRTFFHPFGNKKKPTQEQE